MKQFLLSCLLVVCLAGNSWALLQPQQQIEKMVNSVLEVLQQSELSLKEKKDVTVEFIVAADSLGSHGLLARARALKNEVNQANNIRGAIVEVVETEKLRVLFYTQAANFNVGKLRQVLARDHRIQLDFGLDAIKTVGLSAEATKKSETQQR